MCYLKEAVESSDKVEMADPPHDFPPLNWKPPPTFFMRGGPQMRRGGRQTAWKAVSKGSYICFCTIHFTFSPHRFYLSALHVGESLWILRNSYFCPWKMSRGRTCQLLYELCEGLFLSLKEKKRNSHLKSATEGCDSWRHLYFIPVGGAFESCMRKVRATPAVVLLVL